MCVPCHDRSLRNAHEDRRESLVGGSRGYDLLVTPRGRVAVEDAVELKRLGQRLEESDLLTREAGPFPRVGVAVAVSADEARALERACERQRLGRQRPPGQVAAEDDRVDALTLDVGENGLQRRQVAVDVVERRDSDGVTP